MFKLGNRRRYSITRGRTQGLSQGEENIQAGALFSRHNFQTRGGEGRIRCVKARWNCCKCGERVLGGL